VFCLNGPQGMPDIAFSFVEQPPSQSQSQSQHGRAKQKAAQTSAWPSSSAHADADAADAGKPGVFFLRASDYFLPNRQLAIQPLDFGVAALDMIILGDVFLRRIVTVFDMDSARVGFFSP
jgi:hypothetical protein